MEAFETFEHAGLTVELWQDEDPQSPLEWNNVGEAIGFPSLTRAYRKGSFYDRESSGTEDEAHERGILTRYLRMRDGSQLAYFRVDDYGSSGARVFEVEADDNPSGFLLATPERVAETLGEDATRERIRDALKSEIDVLNQYAQGEVYGYVVRDERGEVMDSLWGIYDGEAWKDESYLRTEARDAAESAASERARRKREIAQGWALAHKDPS